MWELSSTKTLRIYPFDRHLHVSMADAVETSCSISLLLRENIENSLLSCEWVFEFSLELKMEFFSDFPDLIFLNFWGHFVEDNFAMWRKEWHWPTENLWHIRRCSWDDDIILMRMIGIFREDFCSFLDCSNPMQIKMFDEIIHRLHFLSYWIKECHLELSHDELEWNSRESSPRTDIEKLDLILSFWVQRRICFCMYDSSSIIHDYLSSIQWIHEVFLHNPFFITNSWEIGMSIVFYEKREELLEHDELFTWEFEMMISKDVCIHVHKICISEKKSTIKMLDICNSIKTHTITL